MSWRGLRHKGVEFLLVEEWNAVVDALNDLYGFLTAGDKDIYVRDIYARYGYFTHDISLRNLLAYYGFFEDDVVMNNLHANTGYFSGKVFSEGKPVLRDGDPITLYDIQPPAKERITQAIDQAKVTTYNKDVRDTVLKLNIDVYGNLGVTIVEPMDIYGNIRTAPHEPTLRAVLREELAPRREAPKQVLVNHSIPAGGIAEVIISELEQYNAYKLQGYSALITSVKATYDPNATAGVRVRWLYSPDMTNWDSPEDAEAKGNYEDLTFSAGAIRQRTIKVPILANNIKLQIINLDNTYPVTVNVWVWLIR